MTTVPPVPVNVSVDELYTIIGRQQVEIEALRRLVERLTVQLGTLDGQLEKIAER